ncbi:MAG: c-type cytochrome domain-containing protein [Bacteroidota bacterium]
MIKSALPYLFLFLGFVSCKHDQLTESAVEFNFSAPGIIYTGDSFLLSPSAALWMLSPDMGEVTPQHYYKAPSSLLNDSQQVVITATTTLRSMSKTMLIIKKDAYDTVISFTKTIMPLMTANCNFQGCHGNGSKAGKVDLHTYEATMNTVVKHQASKSLLYLSLIKPDPVRRMPPAGALHAYRIDYFKKWIEQGALNN